MNNFQNLGTKNTVYVSEDVFRLVLRCSGKCMRHYKMCRTGCSVNENTLQIFELQY